MRYFLITLIAFLSAATVATAQTPLGSAFTYQGQLAQDGVNVSGNCDFSFGLWDAATDGFELAPPISTPGVSLNDGQFTVELDFGGDLFIGDARWLEISVLCPGGAGVLTTLNPRQELTAAPHATYAISAGGADWAGLTGVPAELLDGDDVDDADNDPGNETQDLTLSNNTLSLSDDPTPVDLSAFAIDTDDQTLTEILAVSGNAGAGDISNLGDVTLGNGSGSTHRIEVSNGTLIFGTTGGSNNRLTIQNIHGNVSDAIRVVAPSGGVDMDAGSWGIDVDTSGVIDLNSNSSSTGAVRIYASAFNGGVDIDAGSSGVDIDTNGRVDLNSTGNNFNAIKIGAPSGGVDMDAGSSGIDVDTSGVLDLNSSSNSAGAVRINASAFNGGVDIDAGSSGVDIDTNGRVGLNSANGNSDAIRISASDFTGGVAINAGFSGVDVDTTGRVDLNSANGNSDAIRISASDFNGGVDIDSGFSGVDVDTTGRVDLNSTSSNFDAIRLSATNFNGGVFISATNSNGGVVVDAGSAGVDVDTNGRVDLNSAGNNSDAIRISAPSGGVVIGAGSAGVDVDTNGRVDLNSAGNNSDAIRISAPSGGVVIGAGTSVTIDDVLKITPRSTAPICDAGTIYYDSDDDDFCVCRGSTWYFISGVPAIAGECGA